jgi:hypothetical protein
MAAQVLSQRALNRALLARVLVFAAPEAAHQVRFAPLESSRPS